MALERVEVLEVTSPSDIVLRNVQTLVTKTKQRIFNCFSVANIPHNYWPDAVGDLLRHWLLRAGDQVWFYRVDDSSGLLFFRDPQGRIINANKMLCALGKSTMDSFVNRKKESNLLKKLLEEWEELHELTIDYEDFRDFDEEKRKKEKLSSIPEAKRSRIDGPEEVANVTLPVKAPEVVEFGQYHFKYYPGEDPVFVYGKKAADPFRTISEVDIPSRLLVEMKPNRASFQLHLWPQIGKGRSAIAVEPQDKRQMTMEIPVFHFVHTKIKGPHKQTAPIVVIITDTFRTAISVENNLVSLNQGDTTKVRLRHLISPYGLTDEQINEQMLCDMLVVTLSGFLDLLERRSCSWNWRDVDMLVMKNVHNMSHVDITGMAPADAKPWEAVNKLLMRFEKKQILAFSQEWCPILPKVFKYQAQSAIYFGNALEVAMKSGADLKLKISNTEAEQVKHLFEILRRFINTPKRVGVFFCTMESLEMVKTQLSDQNIPFYSLGDSPTRPCNLFLMTDKTLDTMLHEPLDVLVHFDMPKKTIFGKRFILFADNIVDSKSVESHILLALEKASKVLPEIEFLCKRTSPELLNIFLELRKAQENSPEMVHKKFCETLIIHGECPLPLSCPNRHVLNEFDVPDYRMPLGGTVELRIISVKAPNHFSVEIVPPAAQRSKILADRLRFKLSFDGFFRVEENCVKKHDFSVGDICVFLVEQHRRGVVLAVKKTLDTVEVQCLETGTIFNLYPKKETILELPEKFRDISPQVVDLFLLDIVPIDDKSGWCANRVSSLKIKLGNFAGERFTAFGKIAASLQWKIFVSELKVYELLKQTSGRLMVFDVKENLLQDRMAKASERGIKNFLKMCDDFDIQSRVIVPEDLVSVVEEDEPRKSSKVEEEDEEMKEVEEERAETIPKKEEEEGEFKEISVPEDDDEVEDFINVADEFEEEDYYDEDEEEFWDDEEVEPFEYRAPEEFDEEDFDFNFDHEDLVDIGVMSGYITKTNNAPVALKNVPENPTEEMADKEEDSQVKAKKAGNSPLPLLISEVNYPQMFWSQSDDEIKIRISATDVVDYELNATEDSLEMALEFPTGEIRGGVINLFGCVDVDQISVILRGLVLIVTLPKVLPGKEFKWPRLLRTEKNMNWLKYYHNFCDVDNEDLDEMFIGELAERNTFEDVGEEMIEEKIVFGDFN